jgi:hypothetical protein
MRAGKHTRRGPAHGVSGALLTTGLLTAALLATAVLATSASAPTALTRVTTTRVTSSGTGAAARAHRTGAKKTPGWRVVKTLGPDNQGVSGTLTAHSAKDAWSVWTGTRFTAVERLTGTTWTQVPIPAKFIPYVRSALAFDGESARDFWLFSSHSRTEALRYTGAEWTLVPIPSWVLRRIGTSSTNASAAAFGPRNVWVFSLHTGEHAASYAAHYNGRAWTRVTLPTAFDEVSAVGAGDIWALAGTKALHWNGRAWTAIKIPAAAGKQPYSFGDLVATGPGSAWVLRSVVTPTPSTEGDTLHWNGTRWQRVGGLPADIIDSIAPDGSGGLWATALDITPGGFNLFYHLTGGRWTEVDPPAGIWDQEPEYLTWIPGTRSLWGTAAGLTNAGNDGVFIKYGP